jgi:hypothetical protein
MPIPTQIDYRLSEIESLAACVVGSLRNLKWNPQSDGRQLRERLQEFVDAVTDCANEIIATR